MGTSFTYPGVAYGRSAHTNGNERTVAFSWVRRSAGRHGESYFASRMDAELGKHTRHLVGNRLGGAIATNRYDTIRIATEQVGQHVTFALRQPGQRVDLAQRHVNA